MTACQASPESYGPPTGIHGKEVYTFERLEDLVAASPVIVLVTVTSVESGRTVGTGEGEWKTNLATLRVEQVIAGEAREVIAIEETGTNGVPYLAEGDRAVLSLIPYQGRPPREDVPFFVNIGSQGRFLVEDDGTVAPAGDADVDWLSEFRGQSLEALIGAIRAA